MLLRRFVMLEYDQCLLIHTDITCRTQSSHKKWILSLKYIAISLRNSLHFTVTAQFRSTRTTGAAFKGPQVQINIHIYR